MKIILLIVFIVLALLFPACLINAVVLALRGDDKVSASNSKIGACISFAAIVLLMVLLIGG